MRVLKVAVIDAENGHDAPAPAWGPGVEQVPALDADGEPRFGGVDVVVVRVATPADERGLLAIGRVRRDYPTLPILALVAPEAAPFGTALVRSGADAYQVEGRGLDALDAQLRSLVARCEREAEDVIAASTFTLWVDAENVVRRCEGAVREILGREPRDLIGRTLNDLVPTDIIPLASIAVEQVRRGEVGGARVQVRAEHASGRILRLEGNASPAKAPGEVRVTLRDVTEEWTAAQALRESEKRFESFLNAAPIGIAVVDAAGHLAVTNERFQRMMGYDAEELAVRSVADLTHPEDLPKDEALFIEVVTGKRDSYQLEKRYIRKDGEIVRGRLTVFVERDEEGRPAVGYGMMEDITETRALEDQLRQAQKLEALGRLAGGVAHDFNNLLTSIRGSAALLLEDLPPRSAFRTEAREILTSSERAAHLTRQLLTFSRKSPGSEEVLDPAELIRGMDLMLRRLIPASIELRAELSERTGRVRLDRTHFEQVIVNLVVNAADAVGERGGAIRVTTKAIRADPDGRGSARPFVRISVQDNGSGMDEQVRSRIFEPFFTTKAPGKGTGLGLATVYGIVTQAGGRIDVDSEPGMGTTFIVDLPAVAARAAAGDHAGPPQEREEARDSATVLLVEDNPAVLRLAERVLSRTGFRVVTASHGEDALAALERLDDDPIDLLLTDAIMPGMPGSELAGAVRRRYPRARVLFMSGYNADEVIDREMRDGSASFLPKPFTPQELRAKVRDALSAAAPED